MLHEGTSSDLGSARPRRRAAAKPCGERWRSPRSDVWVSGLVLLALRCLGFSGVWLVISQRAKTSLAATRVGALPETLSVSHVTFLV